MPAAILRSAAVALLLAAAAACTSNVDGNPTVPSATAAPTPPVTASSAAPPTTGGPSPTAVPTTTGSPTSDPGSDRAAVEKTFDDYRQALPARDFGTVCSLTAPQAADALITAVNGRGGRVNTCEQAFTTVYAVPGAGGPLDEAARSVRVQDVAVSGDTATVTYSAAARGLRQDGLTNDLRRIDGQWRVLAPPRRIVAQLKSLLRE